MQAISYASANLQAMSFHRFAVYHRPEHLGDAQFDILFSSNRPKAKLLPWVIVPILLWPLLDKTVWLLSSQTKHTQHLLSHQHKIQLRGADFIAMQEDKTDFTHGVTQVLYHQLGSQFLSPTSIKSRHLVITQIVESAFPALKMAPTPAYYEVLNQSQRKQPVLYLCKTKGEDGKPVYTAMCPTKFQKVPNQKAFQHVETLQVDLPVVLSPFKPPQTPDKQSPGIKKLFDGAHKSLQ